MQLTTKPYGDMRGHTGFLMFATRHVDFVHASEAADPAGAGEAEAEAEAAPAAAGEAAAASE